MFPDLQQRVTVGVDLDLLKVVLVDYLQDLIVLSLDVFYVSSFLHAFHVTLLPVAHCFKAGIFKSVESYTLLIVILVKNRVRLLVN